jgi:hypothetical protein
MLIYINLGSDSCMRNYLPLRPVVATVLLLFACTAVSQAADASYHITGSVVDINGNGIPGVKVTLYNKGLLTMTESPNPAWTASTGPDTGKYTFDMSRIQAGDYQIVVEFDGKQSSTLLKVAGNYSTYTAKTIMISNYAVSPTNPPPAATPTPTPEPSPLSPTPAPSPAATENATVVPPGISTAPLPSITPKPTPGVAFTFVPAAIAMGLAALRKRD